MESSTSVKTSDIYYAAVNFLHGKEYGRAISLLQSISNKEGDTDLDVIHNALSTAFLQLGDAKNATHHVLEAIDINPNPMYYANLAQIEMYRFKPLEAIEECEFGLKLPDVPDKARTQLLLKQVSAFNMARMHKKGYNSLRLLPKDKPEYRVYLGMAQVEKLRSKDRDVSILDSEMRPQIRHPRPSQSISRTRLEYPTGARYRRLRDDAAVHPGSSERCQEAFPEARRTD